MFYYVRKDKERGRQLLSDIKKKKQVLIEMDICCHLDLLPYQLYKLKAL